MVELDSFVDSGVVERGCCLISCIGIVALLPVGSTYFETNIDLERITPGKSSPANVPLHNKHVTNKKLSEYNERMLRFSNWYKCINYKVGVCACYFDFFFIFKVISASIQVYRFNIIGIST